MKFLPENQKRTVWLLVVLVMALGGIIYLNFFRNQFPPAPVATPAATPGQISQPGNSLLPYGTKIDVSILSQQKFQSLKSVPKVTVTREELGKTELFEK